MLATWLLGINPTCSYLASDQARVQKFGEISNLLFFPIFFSFLLTWGHMGEKTSNNILSEGTQQICSKKSGILLGRVSTKGCIQKCEISGILANVFVLFVGV